MAKQAASRLGALEESHEMADTKDQSGSPSSIVVPTIKFSHKRDTSATSEEAQREGSHRGEPADRESHPPVPPTLEPTQEALVAASSSTDDDDMPSHGGSLAKWKLMQKSEPSMINSALINGRANLVCDIQAPSSDDSVALVLWYKDDSLAPIYTVDARKARLSFNLRTKPAQLELTSLRQEDEGEYRCRVDFKRGRTVNTIISLRIIVPPSELAIYLLQASASSGAAPNPQSQGGVDSRTLPASDNNNQHKPLYRLPLVKLSGVDGASHFGGLKSQSSGQPIGPFNEDADLELLCQARGGKPRPQLQWRRDFNVINTTASTANYLARHMHLSDNDETSAVLRVNSLNRQHLLSIFTCQASNNNLTSPLQSSITLDLNLKPQEVTLRRVQPVSPSSNAATTTGQTMATGPLLIGQTATFECTTTGSRPQATIHWLFQGQRHDSPMNVDQQQTSSKLTLVLQRSFNQQPLTCVAENPRIASSSSSSSPSPSSALPASSNGIKQTTIKLDVHYAPQLSIKLDKRHHYSLAASGEPSSGQERSSQSVDTLDSSPAGDSELLASNRQLQHQQQGALVDASLLQEGNDIYLTCHMDANPRPLKPIVWRFNGRPIVPQSPGSGGGGSLTSTGSAGGQAAAASAALLQAYGNQQPQQQEQGAIMISNQSLVLRKVRRHQSGSYTCEASNQHGSNTSRPFELVIRHAPVCSSDDIIVFEAAVGQTVSVDCRVQANPANSVHYSWFASLGQEQNVTDWLQRDAVLDEQIDENSSLLKFKIKDKNSFGLLKCRAKNAIGLQQKECLFQISPAKVPALHHTCSLAATSDGTGQYEASTSSNSLQVECKLSEHLKTNQEQQQQQLSGTNNDNSAPPSSSAFSWMKNFRAIKQSLEQQQQLGGGHMSELGSALARMPQMRRVYPPDWLLAEIYQAKEAGGDSSDISSSSQAPPSSEINYELQAYVIVGASEQLAKIKSIVEENKLFQANPRDIYYVMAKQANRRHQHENAELTHQNQLMSMMSESSSSHNYRGGSHLSQSSNELAAATIVSDSSIELADEFNFTVPNLEPSKRYKLLIYGQNLANKTRDWLVIRGETSKELLRQSQQQRLDGEESANKQQAKSPSHSFKAVHFQADQEAAGGDHKTTHSNYSSSPMAQKSLVLRSDLNDDKVRGGGDTQQDSPPAADNAPLGSSGSNQVDGASGTAGGGDSPQPSDTTKESSSIGKLWVQSKWAQVPLLSRFGAYSDQAFAYVKQRPLLTIPSALIGCLVLGLLVVYLSGLFVGLLKRSRHRRSSDSMSTYSSSCGNGSCGGGGTGNDDNTNGRARRSSHKRKTSSSQKRQSKQDDNDHNDGDDEEDDAREQAKANQLRSSLSSSSKQKFGDEAGEPHERANSSSECQSPANLNSSASLLADQDCRRATLRLVGGELDGGVADIDLMQPLDAIALQQVARDGDGPGSTVTWLTANSGNNGACDDDQLNQESSRQLASGNYQFLSQAPSNLQHPVPVQFMGSLDRRRQVPMLTNGSGGGGIGEPTVYLTQAVANHGHHHHHFDQYQGGAANGNRSHAHFGSIDRRSINIPSYFIQEHQSYSGNENGHDHDHDAHKTTSLYQPLFIHTAPGSITQANGSAYDSVTNGRRSGDLQQSYNRGSIVAVQKHNGESNATQQTNANSDNGASFSSSNECTISPIDQLLRHHQPVAAIRRGTADKQHNRRRQQQASGSSGAGHTTHRVAFDLSNQIHHVASSNGDINTGHDDFEPGDNFAECERAFQSLIKCQQDASSGSNNSTATTNTTADSGHESPPQLLLAGGNSTAATAYLLSSGSAGAYDAGAKSYSMNRAIKQQQQHLPICQEHMFLVQDGSQHQHKQALLEQSVPVYGRVQKVQPNGGPRVSPVDNRTNFPMVVSNSSSSSNGRTKSKSLARRHRQQQQQNEQNSYQNGAGHQQSSNQVAMQLMEFASPSSQESSTTLMHSIDSCGGDHSPSLTNTTTTTTTATHSIGGGSHTPTADDQQQQMQLQELNGNTKGMRLVDTNGESMALILQQNHQMATSFKASNGSSNNNGVGGGSSENRETNGRVLGQG